MPQDQTRLILLQVTQLSDIKAWDAPPHGNADSICSTASCHNTKRANCVIFNYTFLIFDRSLWGVGWYDG